MATGPEYKRFVSWSGTPRRKRFKFQIEFEASGVDPNDMVLALELVDAVKRAARETHDVPAIRLVSYCSDGMRLI